MIPVRMKTSEMPKLAGPRVFNIKLDHPMALNPCPVCDLRLFGKVVLVFVGFDPEDRERGSTYGTGAAVAVHLACTGFKEIQGMAVKDDQNVLPC